MHKVEITINKTILKNVTYFLHYAPGYVCGFHYTCSPVIPVTKLQLSLMILVDAQKELIN